jgi:hypothetical protein
MLMSVMFDRLRFCRRTPCDTQAGKTIRDFCCDGDI